MYYIFISRLEIKSENGSFMYNRVWSLTSVLDIIEIKEK